MKRYLERSVENAIDVSDISDSDQNSRRLTTSTIIFLMLFLSTTTGIPCDSCGNECASACGTKHFRTCCFNYLRKRTDPNAMKMITNKRLIDFIMLQGRAMFTQNELSHERKQQQQRQQQRQQFLQEEQQHKHLLMPKMSLPYDDEERLNGTFILEDLQAYYD